MAVHLTPSERDFVVRTFRAEVYERNEYVEFPHQAAWRLASEGFELLDFWTDPPDHPETREERAALDYCQKAHPVQVLVSCASTDIGAFAVGETGNYAKFEWRMAVPRYGNGRIARYLVDMSSFKGGKSKSCAMWNAGFGGLPGATVDFVGFEYESAINEWNYLAEALMGGPKPMVQKKQCIFRDNLKNGDGYLELPNGASFQVRSWKKKDKLRGGQMTCYNFIEAYQLPGLEIHTGNAQNLRVEKGFSTFTTTPDRPWVGALHKLGHGKNPDWFCVCGSTAYVNPWAFDLTAMMGDVPDWETLEQFAPDLMRMGRDAGLEPGGLMSREKFVIAWLGALGEFVGSVYQYREGEHIFSPKTHPHLFRAYARAYWQEREAHEAKLQEIAHAVAGR